MSRAENNFAPRIIDDEVSEAESGKKTAGVLYLLLLPAVHATFRVNSTFHLLQLARCTNLWNYFMYLEQYIRTYVSAAYSSFAPLFMPSSNRAQFGIKKFVSLSSAIVFSSFLAKQQKEVELYLKQTSDFKQRAPYKRTYVESCFLCIKRGYNASRPGGKEIFFQTQCIYGR